MIEIQHDSNNNPYIDHENIRITMIVNREPATDWQGSGGFYLRIQAYHDSGRLMPGAEVPLNAPVSAFELLAKVSYLLSRYFAV